MEFVKNKVQEIWTDQAFVSSQMDGVESRLVALERVAASFSLLSLNIGSPLRPSSLTSTTPPVPRVRGQMQWPIMGIRPPSPSDLVEPL